MFKLFFSIKYKNVFNNLLVYVEININLYQGFFFLDFQTFDQNDLCIIMLTNQTLICSCCFMKLLCIIAVDRCANLASLLKKDWK